MQENDEFKNWLQENLEDEMNAIHFSPKARAQVTTKIKTEITAKVTAKVTEGTAANDACSLPKSSFSNAVRKHAWRQRSIAFPWTVCAASILLLLIVTGYYVKTLFFVTPHDIARFNEDRQIILPGDNTPFGAMQMANLQLPDQGVTKK